jgi:signal transduction histidine kinase
MHPSKLDHLGLVEAVKEFCDEISKHQDLKIEFRYPGFPVRKVLPKDVKLCLYRIVQESLHNVVKHSAARKALIVLEKTDQAVRLSVSDDGCGFDAETTRSKAGLGLISMRERLRFVGGEISIRSQPSRGTRIDVSVPLSRQA